MRAQRLKGLRAFLWGASVAGLAMATAATEPPPPGIPLVLGATVSGRFLLPDQEHRYTIDGAPGQRLYYDALGDPFGGIRILLLGPEGAPLGLEGDAGEDAGPCTLIDAGVVTLAVRSGPWAGGWYSFRLIDVLQAPARALEIDTTVRGTLDPAGSVAIYRLEGQAGQRLLLRSTLWLPAACKLYGPGNDLWWSEGWASPGPFVLPGTGTSLLIVGAGATNGVLPYEFRAGAAPVVSASLVLGAVTAGTIRVPGEEHRHTFSGQPGHCLFYVALESPVAPLPVCLLGPGHPYPLFAHGAGDYSEGPIELTEPGVYTVVVGGQNATTGDYKFRLVDLADVPALPLDTPFTGVLDPPWDGNFYRVQGKAGDRFTATTLSDASTVAGWSMFSPAGNPQTSAPLGVDLNYTLYQRGTYYLHVMGNGRRTGATAPPLRYELLARRLPDPPVPVSGFSQVVSGSLQRDATGVFQFTAPAGTPFFLDNLAPGGNVALAWGWPNRTSWPPFGFTLDFGPYESWQGGTHTLTLTPADGVAAADYAFRLLDCETDALPLPPGEPCVARLRAPYEAAVYRLDAVEGLRLFYDALEPAGGRKVQRRWDLYRGFCSNYCDAFADCGPVFAPSTAPSYLVLGSDEGAPVRLSFRVLDLGQAPGLELGSPVQVALPPWETAAFQFDAAPAHLFFDNLGPAAGEVTWECFDPGNRSLARHPLAEDFEVTVSRPGACLLLFHNQADQPSSVSFRVMRSSIVCRAVEWNEDAVQLLPLPGDEVRWSFTGAPGQRLYYRSLDAQPRGIGVRLQAPGGTLLFAGDASLDAGPFALIEPGVYVLTQHNGSSQPAVSPFRLLDVRRTPLLRATVAGGQVTLSWLSLPGQRYRVQFARDLLSLQWIDLGSALLSGGSATTTTDTPPAADRQRFYRVLGGD